MLDCVTALSSRSARFGGLMLVGLLALGLASPSWAQRHPEDPWEAYNRKVYAFNKTLDVYVIRPLAVGYRRYVPGFAKAGVSNFFGNLGEVRVFANDVLQLKWDAAVNDSGRFVINTTLGLGGLLDVASDMGLERNNEDFGQTLGYWGVDTGPYLVLPFFGNSTLRDTFSMAPDVVLNPVWWIEDDRTRIGLYALAAVDLRTSLLNADQMIRGDEYSFVRDALLQRREYLVNDGQQNIEQDEWDDWDEDW